MRKLKSFISNTDGHFAIMFAIISTMIAVGIAMAIDVSGMYKARSELQSHLDSATLAAVIELSRAEYVDSDDESSRDEAYKAVVLKVLETNGFDLGGVIPEVTARNGILTVNAVIPYKLQFGGVLKKATTDVSAISEVALPDGGSPVEIALVLDNTESMNFDGKMGALREGARDFIEAIEESDSGSKIALVPFSRYVDVGTDKRDEPWLDVPAEYDTDRIWQQATHIGGTCTTETRTRFRDGFEQEYQTDVCIDQITTYEERMRVIESRWIGCVGIRSDGLHMQDGPYTTADTRIPALLHKVPKEVTGLDWDTESWCPRVVTPLTDDYSKLRTEIAELYGTDRTYIPMGLTWGRRILSPEAPFTETDTVNPKRKIMILMSDGQNTALIEDALWSQEHLTAPPYIRELSPSEQGKGVIAEQANADTARLCELVKSDGTELFTIAFKVDNALTRELLRNCVSSPQNYFDAGTNTSLVKSFKNISDSLKSEIRMVR